MHEAKFEYSLLNRLAQLVVIVAVMLSFTAELASAFLDVDSYSYALEEFGSESDSEGTIDFEIDKEVEKSQNRNYPLDFDWKSNELNLAEASNLGLAHANTPLLFVEAPPPDA